MSTAEYQRRWRRANPGKQAVYAKRWSENDPDRVRSLRRKWWETYRPGHLANQAHARSLFRAIRDSIESAVSDTLYGPMSGLLMFDRPTGGGPTNKAGNAPAMKFAVIVNRAIDDTVEACVLEALEA